MTTKELPVHPAAAIFPMMTEEELADLAADIKKNGLKSPLVTGVHDGREVLIDGRNRKRACEIAGIEPKYEKLNGEDQQAFIISANLKRRHLNSGQRAMAMAMMYPTGKPGSKNSPTSSVSQEVWAITQASLSHARTVLADSRALAEEVMSGAKFLDAAYRESKARLDANRGVEEKRQRVATAAPDLHVLVQDSRMTLDDALAALNERERKAKEIAQHGRQAAQQLGDLLSHVAAIAMAFQQGERGMIDPKKFAAIGGAMSQLVKLHSEGA